MNKLLRISVAALLVALSGTAVAQDYTGQPGRKHVCTYTVGDAMGEAGGITKMEHFFYGSDNLPLRGALLGAGTTSDFTLAKYYLYAQSEEAGNNLITFSMSQWGKYDFGDMGLKPATVQEKLTYNSQGLLTNKVTQTYAYAYEYNTAGALTKEIWTIAQSGALNKTFDYTLNAQGQPTSAIETNASGAFVAKYLYDYDEQGNLVEKTTYKRKAATDESTEYLNVIEQYIYDANGVQTEYVKYGSGSATADPKLTSRKTYSAYNGNPNKIQELSFSSPKVDAENNVTWKQSATSFVYEYADFAADGRQAWAIDDLAATSSAEQNDVVLTFTAPQNASETTKYAIFRSGVPVATVAHADVAGEGNTCTYTEQGVRLGGWEYFVIPFEGESLLNITANTQRYTSNVAAVKVQTNALKAVENLTYEVKKNIYTQQDEDLGTLTKTEYEITLKWDANEALANASFKGHTPYFARTLTNGTVSNVMLTDADITDATATSLTFAYMNSYDEMKVFVVSHFEEGNAISDTLTITKADVEAMSTEPVTVYGLYNSYDGLYTASFDLNDVKADAPAAITKGTVGIDGVGGDVVGAATVGNKYVMFYQNFNYDMCFATVNFDTDNLVDVNNYAYKYGKPGYMIQSMTYDAPGATLYALEKVYDEAADALVTAIYTVNDETGELTEASRLYDEYDVITTDGKGTLYVIKLGLNERYQSVPSLWKLNSDLTVEETATVANTEVTVQYSTGSSTFASPEGDKIYYVTGKLISVFDLNAKTVANLGETEKALQGLTLVPGNVDGETQQAPVEAGARKMVSKTWYGDAMGIISSTQDMTKEVYFYNIDGKLERVAKYGRCYNDDNTAGDYELTHYTKNLYDYNQNITSSTKFQRGLYDYGDFAMKQVSETTYEYNEAGLLVKENTPSEIYTYTYDEAGNVATKTITNVYNNQEIQTIQYVDYAGPNMPTTMISTGAYDCYNYVGNINYDENGNKVLEMHNKQVEDPDFGGMMPMPFEVEEWAYDGTQLKCYTKYYFDNQGQAQPSIRTVYTPVEGNANQVEAVDETYNNGTWYTQSGSRCIIEYADFSGMNEMTYMEMMLQTDEDTPSTVHVVFTLPQIAYSSPTQIAIYRDGQKVAQDDAVNLYDFDAMVCHYADTDVRNGSHEYYVQAVVGVGDEMMENVEWNGYFISYPQEILVQTNLPAVTDLKLEGARIETTTQGFTQTKTQVATVGWTNPADRPDCFIKNDVIFEGMQVAEASTETPDAEQLDVEVNITASTSATLFVLTRYTLGNVKSEPLTITLEDFTTATAIDGTDAEGNAYTYADNVFSVSQPATLSVYTTAGQLVAKASEATSVNLTNLTTGTYVVLVQRGESVKAYKVAKN